MKYHDYELDKEEQAILDDFEKRLDEAVVKPGKDFAARKRLLIQAAKNTTNKTRNINIRLSEADIYKLKAKAVHEGIPYQTLIASILHKTANAKQTVWQLNDLD